MKLYAKTYKKIYYFQSLSVINYVTIIINSAKGLTKMSKEISVTLTNDMEVFLTKKSKKSKLPIKNIIENLISEKIDNKIYFEEGFYFDKQKNKLFRPDGKSIEFTKLQNGLFHLLLEKKDKIIDFETIHKVVWKNKTMSIFTMRNVVKRIRDLTYYGLIINHSNKGYELGTIK